MPDRSDKVERLYDESPEYTLPYISKSRVVQWIKNPEHFRLKYLEEIKEPETAAMVRGTQIHETFEHFYEWCIENETFPGDDPTTALPDNRELWQDHLTPYIANFLDWERSRWEEADQTLDDYLPVSVEEEHWRDPLVGEAGEPEWMGLADVILPARGVPGVPDADGVVIVDFKTGSVPDEQYRSKGIYTELAYYEILFEGRYDVVATGAYYPREDTALIQPGWTPDEYSRPRENVLEAARDMVRASREYEGGDTFEINPGPLCGWSPEDGDRSSYYGLCSQCTWNVPIDNRNQLEQLVEEGYSEAQIADHLGCDENEVHYWKYKLDL